MPRYGFLKIGLADLAGPRVSLIPVPSPGGGRESFPLSHRERAGVRGGEGKGHDFENTIPAPAAAPEGN